MPALAGFSENALKILKARYFLKDEKGELVDKTPEDLFRRVAAYVATAEKNKAERKKYGEAFLRIMSARDFLPNSPTLTGAGRGMCLSACFVLPDRGLPRRHLRDGQERRARPQGGRGHRLRLQPPPAQGQLRPQDAGRRLRADLVPQGHRRRDRGRQAGRHPPRRQHGHPPRRPPRHRGVRPDEARRRLRLELQHLRRRHGRLHGRPRSRGRVRPRRPAPRLRRSAARTPARSSSSSSSRPGPSATPASSSSTGSTPATPPPASAPSGPRTPAANSPSTITSPATSAPSTWPISSIPRPRTASTGTASARSSASASASSTTSSTSTATRCP